MGVSYDAMIYIGVEVEGGRREAKQWIKENTTFTDEEIEDCLEDASDRKLEVQCENYYSGKNYFVGFEVSASDYKIYDQLMAKFEMLTGVNAEILTFSQIN